jgi:Fic family protein
MIPDMSKDRGERTALMEPLCLPEGSRHRARLTDLALDLAVQAAGFRRSLPPLVLASLADLVRAMNCYYSNLIEGHDTHPIDIERAIRSDLSKDPRKRELQLEARAHVEVQRWIDAGGLKGAASTPAGLGELHRRFYQHLPDELRWSDNPDTGARLRMEPGELRESDVKVGGHVAISPGAVPRFLEHFGVAYAGLGRTDAILAAAAAHHRLLWIHPFLDGNGRVARLMSHAMLVDALDTGGVWSIARGLARNVDAYRAHLAACDQPRRNDLDGRGALSEEALATFTGWFLETCLDQVRFMETLVQPDRLQVRMRLWADEEIALGHLPATAGDVLQAVLYRGELPRGEVASVLGKTARQGRRIVAALQAAGLLHSDGPRAPYHLTFPATLAGRWFPGLFPER